MLAIRLLGELEVKRDGVAVPLPASRKSRALLAYLAATRRPHLRERLCDLLWDGPDDPRAALRWSLTKLRPIVDPHLVAGRDRVEMRCDGMLIDIDDVCIPGNATTEKLKACAALFRGEFLDGLDLPGCFRYQQWCSGERERLRNLHVGVLAELTRRLGDDALPYARRRVEIDPFNDEAHAALIRLLPVHDAIRAYEDCRTLFERELGSHPGEAVENARRAVWNAAASPPLPSSPSGGNEVAAAPKMFVGREPELKAIAASTQPVLITGESGIGKSRLLDEVRTRTAGVTVYGRAFAAEMVRPYGVWIDALGDFPTETDRMGLFDAVIEKLERVSLIAIDDLQWIDESSAALLHYATRYSKARIVCAARVGEIDDNPHAKRLARDMRPIRLGPMSAEALRQLVSDERAAQLSGGNPLFALELARSSDSATPAASLIGTISERLAQLEGPAREVVAWAAAIGRQFDAEIVGRATGMAAGEMLAALERLERLAVIRPSAERTYDFTHDLIRDAAYQMISGPRRVLVHRHIARALEQTHDPDGALAGEIMHHAFLAGDHDAAAAAAVRAGKRCMRMFAYAEAVSVARRALQITNDLEKQLKLLHIIVFSRVPTQEKIGFLGQLVELTETARRTRPELASLGAALLACMYEETNQYVNAAGASMQMVELSRWADPAKAALAIANAARCLLVLHRDIGRAEMLVRQAESIGIENRELPLAIGYLHAHHGRTAEAIPYLEHGYAIANSAQDHWREWIALHRLTTLALENDDAPVALRHCERLRDVAAKMKGGSEGVRTHALETIAKWIAGQPAALDEALDQLREADCKIELAWALCYVAVRDASRATAFATEALAAAEAVGRPTEVAIARCLLGLPVKPSPDISAPARIFLRERRRHARSRRRAQLRPGNHA